MIDDNKYNNTMGIRFKTKSDIFNIVVTAVAAVLSVGIMLYGVVHFGLENTWPELVLNCSALPAWSSDEDVR